MYSDVSQEPPPSCLALNKPRVGIMSNDDASDDVLGRRYWFPVNQLNLKEKNWLLQKSNEGTLTWFGVFAIFLSSFMSHTVHDFSWLQTTCSSYLRSVGLGSSHSPLSWVYNYKTDHLQLGIGESWVPILSKYNAIDWYTVGLGMIHPPPFCL